MNNVYSCHIKNELSKKEENFLSEKFLSPSETGKANTIKDIAQRAVYIQSHAFKRNILSAILGKPSREIQFYTNSFGKPFLVQPIGQPPLFFNLSHTCGLAALIVSDHKNTGIDVEKITKRNDLSLLQHSIYTAVEMAEANTITDPKSLTENFFRIWVIKECFLKAIGTGFGIEPSSLKIENRGNNIFLVKAGDDKFSIKLSIYCQLADGFALAYTNAAAIISTVEKYIFNGDFVKQ